MSETLRDCPFCGKPGGLASHGEEWAGYCGSCLVVTAMQPTEAEAIAAWNRRAEPVGEPVAWRPIETAPKDKWVLLTYPGTPLGVRIGRLPSDFDHAPTHWMPLPVAPREEKPE